MLRVDQEYEDVYAKEFMREFSEAGDVPKYVYGVNLYTESIIRHYKIDGVIAEKVQQPTYCGVPVKLVDGVEDNALVVQVIRGIPVTEERRIRQYQFRSIDLFSFIRYSGNSVFEIDFWQGFREDFEKNRDKYDRIYDLLSDAVSKNQFFNLINFRLSHNLRYMKGFVHREKEQYFEDFFSLEPGEVFADVGGFDGFTTAEFIKRCPAYGKVYFFEPDDANTNKAKSLLNGHQHIEYMKYGLSNKREKLYFESSGPQSKISDSGTNQIEVVRLSEVVSDKITFLKMDIEGLEYEALEGSRELIEKYHPKLAIAVYHKANDFWKIPELILSIRSDYKLYIRHYTEGISETVMYFIPKK